MIPASYASFKAQLLQEMRNHYDKNASNVLRQQLQTDLRSLDQRIRETLGENGAFPGSIDTNKDTTGSPTQKHLVSTAAAAPPPPPPLPKALPSQIGQSKVANDPPDLVADVAFDTLSLEFGTTLSLRPPSSPTLPPPPPSMMSSLDQATRCMQSQKYRRHRKESATEVVVLRTAHLRRRFVMWATSFSSQVRTAAERIQRFCLLQLSKRQQQQKGREQEGLLQTTSTFVPWDGPPPTQHRTGHTGLDDSPTTEAGGFPVASKSIGDGSTPPPVPTEMLPPAPVPIVPSSTSSSVRDPEVPKPSIKPQHKSLDWVQCNGSSKYQVKVRVVGVRDLPLSSDANQTFHDLLFQVEFTLLTGNRRAQNGSFPSKKTLFTPNPRFPNELTVFDLAESEQVAVELIQDAEIQLELIVLNEPGSIKPIKRLMGKLQVPLALLETPYAQDQELCRWFPLEKPRLGVVNAGEVRLQVTCNVDSSKVQSDASTLSSTSCSDTNQRPAAIVSKPATTQDRQKAGCRKSKKRSNATGDDGGYPLSPQKKPTIRAVRERSGDLLTKSAATSTSTCSIGEEPPSTRSSTLNSPSTTAIKATNRPPSKQFLRRKPHKVVFEKLDWSRVSAKTDSNLNNGPSQSQTQKQLSNQTHANQLNLISFEAFQAQNQQFDARNTTSTTTTTTSKDRQEAKEGEGVERSPATSDGSSSCCFKLLHPRSPVKTLEQLQLAIYERCGIPKCSERNWNERLVLKFLHCKLANEFKQQGGVAPMKDLVGIESYVATLNSEFIHPK